MVENNNASKAPASGEFIDVKKYYGVASVKVLAINPKNATLRKYGWTIDETAAEPNYIHTADDGSQSTRVRFLVEIQDIDPKPVISLDFWIRPGIIRGSQSGKFRIIDSFGRVAWASESDVKSHQIPQYSNGPAQISKDYGPCHAGQDKLIAFLYKLLNLTPLTQFNRQKNEWVPTKNPGRLTIDDWKKLCTGDVTELMEYLSLQPDNCVKVVLGVKTTDENRTYQTFLSDCDGTTKIPYLSNSSIPDKQTGEYTVARKRIDEFYANHQNSGVTFSASPVTEWKESATDVQDNSGKMFDEDGNYIAEDDDSDLPFGG